MYPEYMNESLQKVAQTRGKRLELAKTGKPVYPLMDAAERKEVLDKFHPDFQKGDFDTSYLETHSHLFEYKEQDTEINKLAKLIAEIHYNEENSYAI